MEYVNTASEMLHECTSLKFGNEVGKTILSDLIPEN